MKGIRRAGMFFVCMIFLMGITQVFADSGSTEDKIKEGVSIDSVNVSNMSRAEAKEAVEDVVKEKMNEKVVLTINKDQVTVTLKELGYKWTNKSVIDEAVSMGKSGNIIKRYKDDLDLKEQGKNFKLEINIKKDTLKANIEDICEPYNIEAKNASLKATGSGFEIIAEKEGCVVDSDATTDELYKYLTESWDGKSEVRFTATTKVSKPKYTTKDCKKVSNTPMGTFYTTFSVGSSYENRNMNIKNGAEKIDGHVIYPGEQFSCNAVLAPWTEDNGWYPAGTYVDGGVADSLGGGICQVSSTLYNALLNAEIKIVERYPHSMAVSYVDLAADAALAGDYKDLVFENDTDAPIYVQGIYDLSGYVKFNIYGHDTRKAGHSVKYISETVGTTPIKTEVKKDDTKPKGYTETVLTGHVGYVAKLWKVTYEDGVEVSKELLHTSRYAMAPTKVIKGTGKTDKEDVDEDESKDKEDKEKTTIASDDETKKASQEETSKKKKESSEE